MQRLLRGVLAAALPAALAVAAYGQTPAPALAVRVESDKAVYAPGETARFTVTAQSASNERHAFEFRSGQTFDLNAYRVSDGVGVARWSHDRMFTQALRPVEFLPTTVMTQDIEWSLVGWQPGEYMIFPDLGPRIAQGLTYMPQPIRITISGAAVTPTTGRPQAIGDVSVLHNIEGRIQSVSYLPDGRMRLVLDGIQGHGTVSVTLMPESRVYVQRATGAELLVPRDEILMGRYVRVAVDNLVNDQGAMSANAMRVVVIPHRAW
jgi:hypothetical protein